MKINTGFYHTAFLILFMTLLAGCKSKSDVDIFVGTETCRPPCWMGIEPGVTGIDNSIVILGGQEKKGSMTLLSSGIVWWRTANGKNIYIYEDKNGIVSKINLDLRPRSIHLDDVLELFGEPVYLDFIKVRDGYFFAEIFYPEKGVSFVGSSNKMVIVDDKIGFDIQSNMNVSSGVFFQPSDKAAMIDILYGANAAPDALIEMQEWIGYGIYQE